MEQMIVQPPPLHPEIAEYAGFWKRFVAYLIDKFIFSVLSLILVLPFVFIIGVGAFTAGEHSYEDNGSESFAPLMMAFIGAWFMLILLLVVSEWLYFSLMESKKGATLGKMAMNIRVTDLQGNPISFGRATGRYFGKILSGLILCVGYLMAGWTQQKQALHDILAGSLVVVKR
ncbi:MAG TPA: RDD family protein [Bacteroidota bacterium]|jgi:uncharacterized RDD family membrane protein YckC